MLGFTTIVAALTVFGTPVVHAAFIPLGPDCVKGVTFQGTPQGKIITIEGVQNYVATPKVQKSPHALLLLTDIFGLPPNNSQLMADDFARDAGFATFIPDYLNGDPVPIDGLNDPNFNLTAWSARHGPEQTLPPLLSTIKGLKAKGFKTFATTGYCFGGRYATTLAQMNLVSVSTMAHPSSLIIPDDFETLLASSNVPIQINVAELDTGFSPAVKTTVDGLMDDGQYKPGYDSKLFKGVAHGFAVRANLSDPVQKAAKEGAFFAAVDWLKAH